MCGQGDDALPTPSQLENMPRVKIDLPLSQDAGVFILRHNLRRMRMQIRVKLFATLGRYALSGASGVPFEMELSEGAILDDAVKQLKLPREEVKVFFVNGRARPIDWPLAEGDEVGISPLVAGG
jgi:molybdopterin converting factor small subunit